MRVLVCGDRNYSRYSEVYRVLKAIAGDVTCVIEGEARGADTFGRLAAESMKIPVEKYPAKWSEYGKAAGPIRNQQMLDEGKPDLVLAFHSNINESKGTADMIERAKKAGIPVELIQ